jgi:hypothetical protein
VSGERIRGSPARQSDEISALAVLSITSIHE